MGYTVSIMTQSARFREYDILLHSFNTFIMYIYDSQHCALQDYVTEVSMIFHIPYNLENNNKCRNLRHLKILWVNNMVYFITRCLETYKL